MRQPHIWRWVVIATAFALATPGLQALADPVYGKQVRFAGIHPIPKSEGGGMCYIEGPHVHIYAADPVEYRVHDNDNVFVGDPLVQVVHTTSIRVTVVVQKAGATAAH